MHKTWIPMLLLLLLFPVSAHADDGVRLWTLLRQGGWFMAPLGLCSVVMFFLIFHCTRETGEKRFVPAAALPRLDSLMAARDLNAVREQLDAFPGVLTRVMRAGLDKAHPELQDANKDRVEASVGESLEEEENAVGQWIHYLNVVATVAPMIGLLGTVSGMIGAFQTISEGGMGRPELLAGDIGQALVTTATGLGIGIPAMIAFFVLRNRLENRMLATTRAATALVDSLAGGYADDEQADAEAVAATE